MTFNPYSSPKALDQAATPNVMSSLRFARGILYTHLSSITLLALFSLSDVGLMRLPDVAHALLPFALVTIVACPLAMVYAAIQLEDRPQAFRWGIVVFDCLLSLFQIWVMLPAVQ